MFLQPSYNLQITSVLSNNVEKTLSFFNWLVPITLSERLEMTFDFNLSTTSLQHPIFSNNNSTQLSRIVYAMLFNDDPALQRVFQHLSNLFSASVKHSIFIPANNMH